MKRKKAIAVLFALAVVFTSSGGLPFGGLRLFDTAITASAATNPIYTITIPAEVDLKSTAPVNITAEDVTLGEGQKIIVTLDSASNTDSGSEFSAKTENGKSEVKYKINDGAIGLDDSNKTVAEFTGNGERELNFAVTDESGIKYAGVHTETLTFGVSVEQSEPANVAVSSITIDNAPTEALFVNSTGTLTATVSPDNATDKTVVWSSSDPDYVFINAETGEYTVMGKKGYGSATITATATNGTEDTSDDVTATCTMTGKVHHTSLQAGDIIRVGETIYTGGSWSVNIKPNTSFGTSAGVITLVENETNGKLYYKFNRGSNNTKPNWTSFRVTDNTDGLYIVSGTGTSSDKFTLAVHTK